jgi:hypothetical protein
MPSGRPFDIRRPMIFPFAWDEVSGVPDPEPSGYSVLTQRPGRKQSEVVAGAVEIIRYVAVLSEGPIIPLDEGRDNPRHRPQIAVWFCRLGHNETHVTRDSVITKFSRASGITAGSHGNSCKRVRQRPGSDQKVCRLSAGKSFLLSITRVDHAESGILSTAGPYRRRHRRSSDQNAYGYSGQMDIG